MTDYSHDISTRIQRALDAGATVQEIADAVGLHRSYVSELLHRRRTPLVLRRAEMIAAWCDTRAETAGLDRGDITTVDIIEA